MSEGQRATRFGHCYGMWWCHCPVDPSGRSRTRIEHTVRHPTGVVDDQATATRFGPTDDLHEALRILEVTASDCLCGEGEHVLVSRTVTVTTSEWATT